jgi:hypothetical protein
MSGPFYFLHFFSKSKFAHWSMLAIAAQIFSGLALMGNVLLHITGV